MSFTSNRLALLLFLPLTAVACSSADVGTETTSQSPSAGTVSTPASTPAPAPTSNAAPTISGSPTTSVVTGQAYSFQPSATDPENATLTFAIQNRPSWASFTPASGRLTGTPGSAQAGTFANIVISVTDGTNTVSLPAFTITVTAAPAGGATNRAPTISGTPATSVRVGQAYSFQPTGADADGDTLSYAISNRPAWATFDTATGRLAGTPGAGDVGTTANVVVTVSDGRSSVALPAFSLSVTSAASASTTLTWDVPTLNDDATPLTTLAGFRIVYGTSSANLDRTIQVANPTTTSFVVENLTPGTWFFAVRAYNAAGVESLSSGIASQVIP